MTAFSLPAIIATIITLFVWFVFVTPYTSLKTKRILMPIILVLHLASIVLNVRWIVGGGDEYFFLIVTLLIGVLGFWNYWPELRNK